MTFEPSADVELLVVDECPNTTPATTLLRSVLAELGRSPDEFRVLVVHSSADAERLGFVGSPSFRVGGGDLFATESQAVGLSCRVYPDAPGGLPTRDALREALDAAL